MKTKFAPHHHGERRIYPFFLAVGVTLSITLAVLCLLGAYYFFLAMNSDDCAELPIITRAEWGARPPKHISLLTLPVQYAFIHHTYIPKACTTTPDCIKKVRAIQNYHMDDRGWDDIGYSFLIGGDGHIYEGRGWNRVGAHTKGYNSVGLGFSIIGDYTSVLPSPYTLELTQKLIACGVRYGKLRTNYTLRGHRDMVKTTECPGQRLYDLIRTWPHY